MIGLLQLIDVCLLLFDFVVEVLHIIEELINLYEANSFAHGCHDLLHLFLLVVLVLLKRNDIGSIV